MRGTGEGETGEEETGEGETGEGETGEGRNLEGCLVVCVCLCRPTQHYRARVMVSTNLTICLHLFLLLSSRVSSSLPVSPSSHPSWDNCFREAIRHHTIDLDAIE